jgi:hypothetical protein
VQLTFFVETKQTAYLIAFVRLKESFHTLLATIRSTERPARELLLLTMFSLMYNRISKHISGSAVIVFLENTLKIHDHELQDVKRNEEK